MQQDADWNVTAILSSSGSVVERYVFDTYGTVTYLTASWGSASGSAYSWIYGFQAGRLDTGTKLYNFQHRAYSPTLGRWLSNDPVGSEAGDSNLYRYVSNNPVNQVDPSGLQAAPTGLPTPPPGIVYGRPNPSENTVVSDGKGQLAVRLSKESVTYPPAVQKIMKAHEQMHIEDLLKTNKGAGKDKDGKNLPPGIQVGWKDPKERYKSELRATDDSIGQLQKLLPTLKTPDQKAPIQKYIERLKDYREEMDVKLRKGP